MVQPQITYRGMPQIAATHQSSQDAYAAVSAAFDAVIRQIEDAVHKQRGEVKAHRDTRGNGATP